MAVHVKFSFVLGFLKCCSYMCDTTSAYHALFYTANEMRFSLPSVKYEWLCINILCDCKMFADRTRLQDDSFSGGLKIVTYPRGEIFNVFAVFQCQWSSCPRLLVPSRQWMEWMAPCDDVSCDKISHHMIYNVILLWHEVLRNLITVSWRGRYPTYSHQKFLFPKRNMSTWIIWER